MRVWFKQMSVADVATESTGVHWRPVWNVLDGYGLVLLLANPGQVKHGKGGRATSVIRGGPLSFCTMAGSTEASYPCVKFVI